MPSGLRPAAGPVASVRTRTSRWTRCPAGSKTVARTGGEKPAMHQRRVGRQLLTPPDMGGMFAGMRPKTQGPDPTAKTGYRLPASVVMQVREAVDAGEAKSQNEFVERALRRELRALDQRRLYSEYARAAEDDVWVAGMAATAQAFDVALRDGLDADRP